MIINLGNRVVNTYLISFDDGYILIDTGYPGGFKRFAKNLKKNKIQLDQIKYVFLTHSHDDHAGFLNEVLEATNAKVILHSKAIEVLKRGQNSFDGGCTSLSAYLFCLVLALFGHGEHRYPAIKNEYLNRLVSVGSDDFQKLNFPYKAIETTGHTKDHISLQMNDILFCGDAAMNDFPSKRRTSIWIENLEQFKQTWKEIIDLNPSLLYPAHGKPFKTSDLKKYSGSLDKVKIRGLKKD